MDSIGAIISVNLMEGHFQKHWKKYALGAGVAALAGFKSTKI